MDLRFTPEEIAFRDEVRAFHRRRAARADPAQDGRGKASHQGRHRHLAAHPQRQGLGGAALAERNGAAPTGRRCSNTSSRTSCSRRRRRRRCRSASAWSGRSSSPSAATSRSAASCRASPISTTGGARAFPSRAPARTWPRSRPRPSATATTTSSTARRSGPRWRSTPTGSSAWCAPMPQVKKQEGISFLLIDMRTPGITVRPIVTIDGGAEVNEVFFDDVKVPVENRVGEENKGWDYAKFLLGNERTRHRPRRLFQGAHPPHPRACRYRARGRPPDPRGRALPREARGARDRAEGAGDDAASRRRGRAPARPRRSPIPIPRSSRSRARRSSRRRRSCCSRSSAPMRCPTRPRRTRTAPTSRRVGPDWAGTVAPTYFNWRKISIYGGSNEIQRNIIAKAILGL